MDNLLARLSAAPQAAVEPIQFQAWLAGVFDAGWQALGDLLAPPRPSLAWRSAAVQRAMVLGCEPPLALCLAVEPEAARVNLHVYLLPLAAEAILPAALRLQVLTGAGEVFRELTAVAGDRGLQYEFFCRSRGKVCERCPSRRLADDAGVCGLDSDRCVGSASTLYKKSRRRVRNALNPLCRGACMLARSGRDGGQQLACP